VFQDGATLPIKQTSVAGAVEDIFQMFDAKTRRAVDQNLVGSATRSPLGFRAERHDREPAGAVGYLRP